MSFKTPLGKTIFETKPISAGCEFVSGYAFKSKDFAEFGFPVIKIKNIQNKQVTLNGDNQFIPNSVITEKLNKFKLTHGDILIAMTGQGSVGRVGKLVLNDKQVTPYLNQRVGKFVPHPNVLDKDYLYYCISTSAYESLLFAAGSGSGQPNLSPSIIKGVEIPFPPIKVQESISKILRDLDEKIVTNVQMNQTLEEMAQAIFKSWFVDFEPVKAKMNGELPDGMDAATASLFPEKLVESELGLIPEGWEIQNTGDLFDVKDGTHDSPKKAEEGHYLVTSKHITGGKIDTSSAYLISDADFEKVNQRSKVDTFDILLTMIGTVGEVVVVYDNPVEFAIKNVGLFKTSQRPELVWLFYWHLQSFKMKNYLEVRMAGTTQQYLTLKTLRTIPVILPSEDLLKRFNEMMSPLMEKISDNHKQNHTLASLRDTLLPKLLSGEIELGKD
ncbi:restriction endonuclease subunit S [Shewanella sp. 1CM18E]|uniref:restriction endonuclease subunit S n=1 Tax=Shewanella sp. 1CM18E TaxID=2929169 RepID=UPI0020BFAD4B|nr:restriction endonuclease subunit S [Shewanella sp. 1CM18E]MCK8043685.1 restriction endonuclease subunit S [Shewanella sp. 1CM18E]